MVVTPLSPTNTTVPFVPTIARVGLMFFTTISPSFVAVADLTSTFELKEQETVGSVDAIFSPYWFNAANLIEPFVVTFWLSAVR